MFSQIASYSEQIRRTISLSEKDSNHKLLIKVNNQVTTYLTHGAFNLNKGNFGLNGDGQGSLKEVKMHIVHLYMFL